jgi:hypothetical protein
MLSKARAQIDQVEQMVNWVSDNDREWWPFLFLRPREEERMGSRRVFALSVLHGFVAGMLANVVLALTAGPEGPGVSIWMFPVWTTMVFFVVYRATFAYFWNRRAQRLTGAAVARPRVRQ